MQEIWNVSPWMRRRAQRHLERGSSTKLLRFILNTPAPDRAIPVEPVRPKAESLAHNVILFRALKACS